MSILCSISTRDRYDTTLPLAINSVINQTLKPDHLIIFDDNDNPIDLRTKDTYLSLFKMLDLVGITWEVLFGEKKGQHYNHDKANKMKWKYVLRVDDDNILEPNVLETLMSYMKDDVGAVGGAVLNPNWDCRPRTATGKIEDIDDEPNIQWGRINEPKEVDHLHCSFLYRAGIHDFNLGLSRVAHREETLFSYGLKQKGYKLLVVPCVTWHLKSQGGIRSDNRYELFEHDEKIFRNIVGLKDKTIVVLNCGMGDHIVFKKLLPEIKNPEIYSCYPEIIPGKSIAEALEKFGNIDPWNIYIKMDQWKWQDSLENAFRKLYLK